MKKMLMIFTATGLAATVVGAAAPAPAQAVCDPDPVLGTLCWNDCQFGWLDATDPVGSVKDALRPRVCPA